jgi:hypothetical protein
MLLDAVCATHSLFSDPVFTSTDLNRRGAEVLNSALNGPVTISRNNELFALFKREQAAELVRSVNSVQPVLGLMAAVVASIKGTPVNKSFNWVCALDLDEKREMCAEVLDLTARAIENESDWDEVNAAIHEWKETANLIQSGGIEHIGLSPATEIPLRIPDFADEVQIANEHQGTNARSAGN